VYGHATHKAAGPTRYGLKVQRRPEPAPERSMRLTTEAASSRRVLVAEDNSDGRRMLCWLLRLWGHRVEEARDGPEAVRKALEYQPEVAVVDIGLPEFDGYEVARRLKAALNGRVVLIALTSYGGPEDVRRAFDAGFDAHLTKPADLDELSRLVTSASLKG
jgi:CheY-like chemotaxis protein